MKKTNEYFWVWRNTLRDCGRVSETSATGTRRLSLRRRRHRRGFGNCHRATKGRRRRWRSRTWRPPPRPRTRRKRCRGAGDGAQAGLKCPRNNRSESRRTSVDCRASPNDADSGCDFRCCKDIECRKISARDGQPRRRDGREDDEDIHLLFLRRRCRRPHLRHLLRRRRDEPLRKSRRLKESCFRRGRRLFVRPKRSKSFRRMSWNRSRI